MITITIITVCLHLNRRMNSHLFTFSSKLFVKGLRQLHQIPTGWLIVSIVVTIIIVIIIIININIILNILIIITGWLIQ